jgi:hypothetical protein
MGIHKRINELENFLRESYPLSQREEHNIERNAVAQYLQQIYDNTKAYQFLVRFHAKESLKIYESYKNE